MKGTLSTSYWLWFQNLLCDHSPRWGPSALQLTRQRSSLHWARPNAPHLLLSHADRVVWWFSGKNLFHNFLSVTAFWITAIRVFEMECHLCPWLHPAYLMVQCDHLVTFSDLNSLGKAGPRREPLPRGEDLSFPEENELWIGASLSCSLDFWLRGPARQGGSFNVPLGSQGGFPGGSAGKNPAANGGDSGSIPGSGRSPGEGNGNSLQDSCLENPMDKGAWWATVHWVTKSQARLND